MAAFAQVEALAGKLHVHRRGVAPHDEAVEAAQLEGEVGEALLGAEDLAVLAALHELDDEDLLAVAEGPQGLPEGGRGLALAVAREDHDEAAIVFGEGFFDGILGHGVLREKGLGYRV